MKGSKLRVLRAIVALERFTVADVVGWTGLESSQVIPQISRLQGDQVIELDINHAAKSEGPRPAYRPVRHYRVSTEALSRQKAFDEIRSLRAAVGEDPSAQRLSILQGRLTGLEELLSSSVEKKLSLDHPERAKYQAALQSIGNALDEATLEIDAEEKELIARIEGLRKLQAELRSALDEASSLSPIAEVIPAEVQLVAANPELIPSFGQELRGLLHRLSDDPSRPALSELEGVSAELKPITGQILELKEAVRFLNPDYTHEARLEYALSRVAAEVVPELDILLSATKKLLKVAPDKDRSLFEYNYGNLMAWAGRDEDAFRHWHSSVAEISSVEAPFRIVLGGFVDETHINEKIFEELESAARGSQGVISIASKTLVPAIQCAYSPKAALSDPFLDKIELAAKGAGARYFVYGLLFRDVFRAQPGLSYSRLATTLVRSGADYHRAWDASRRVNRGGILVLLGYFGTSPAESNIASLRSMLETKLSAQVIDLRPEQEAHASSSAVAW
jgi:hypothetical protein